MFYLEISAFIHPVIPAEQCDFPQSDALNIQLLIYFIRGLEYESEPPPPSP